MALPRVHVARMPRPIRASNPSVLPGACKQMFSVHCAVDGNETVVVRHRAEEQTMPANDTGVSAFAAMKHIDEDGREWWSARELGKLLGYSKWQSFAEVVEEAKEVCRINGGETARAENFTDSSKVSGKRGPAGQDYRLTRHACYLVAESADGRKPEVALAKIYFALTTERYELCAA